jgi:glycosyltransferase involved in cell wall biosynthesis
VKVSILLPTRDRADFLPRAIQSVLAQTSEAWELVVLDNGDRPAVVPDDPRIRLVREWAEGPADAFQRALDRASSDVILPMGDDDELAPHTVETILRTMVASRCEWGVALTDYRLGGESRFLLGGPVDVEKLRRDYYLGGAVFWRKRLSDRLGGFDSAYDGAADYDLYLRFAEAEPAVFVREVLYLYTDHPETDSNAKHGRQRDAAARIRAKAAGPRRTVAAVTPWSDHPELIAGYAEVAAGFDEVIVVDQASRPQVAASLVARGWDVVSLPRDVGFAGACNIGYAHTTADIVVFLNNDVVREAGGVLASAVRDVPAGVLRGVTIGQQQVADLVVPYLQGWCVAARREVFDALACGDGPWDAEAFPDYYWEDVDLSLRAIRAGVGLEVAPWPVRHLGGRSTGFPAMRRGFDTQRSVVEARVAEAVGA